MVALKGADIDRFVRSPDPRYSVILVYGPDSGLVHERSRTIARAKVDNPDDPFQLIRMDGDDLGGDTSRIVDEANTLGLFGGKRAIWLRLGSKQIVSALEPLLKEKPENPVIIEAGDLAAKHALRALAEKATYAAALPCYSDEGRDLPRLIDEILAEHGLKASSDAKALMVGYLGADRLLSRREIEKLALFARGKSAVSVEDVEEIMADASALATDRLTDAVFLGDSTGADIALFRSLKEGQDASVLIGALLRHAITLAKSRMSLDRGQSMPDVERQARIFFKRSAAFQKQLSLWTLASLESAIATLGDAQAACRKNASLGESLVSRACLTLAIAARRAQNSRN
jgi:DNA polymerase III subunit delta